MTDTPDLPEEMILTLRRPVEAGGVTYSELHLREPTAGEMLQFGKLTGVEAEIAAVSLVAGVPRTAIEKIGARDLVKASAYLSRFLD